MDNVFSWVYLSPIYERVPSGFLEDNPGYNPRQIIPPRVKSPESEYFTLRDINNRLTPLKFGDKKQIELLKVLDIVGQAMEENFAFKVEFCLK